jgi:hypothetical protein
MGKGLRGSQSLFGVFLKESFEQAEPGVGELVVLKQFKIYLAIFVLLEHLVESFAWEGRLCENEDVEDDSEAEQVAGGGVDCLAALQVCDLGRHVAGSAASDKHELSSCAFG